MIDFFPVYLLLQCVVQVCGTYSRTLPLAELHATADVEAFAVRELEGGKRGRERPLHQVFLVLLGPSLLRRAVLGVQSGHYLAMETGEISISIAMHGKQGCF